ncbi:MAG: TRAP transporter small permease [Desulfonatronovibrionaceae bacterium]
MVDKLAGVVHSINRAFLFLGSLVLCAMMGLAVANMVMGFAGSPIKGAYEASGLLGSMAACLALGPTQQVRGHIAVNILARLIPERLSKAAELVSQVLLLAFCALLIHQLIKLGLSLRFFKELTETMRIPYYPLVFLMAAGFASLLLTLGLQMWKGSWRNDFSCPRKT